MTEGARILITGAGGQLGRALARAVWPEGMEVMALSRAQLDITKAAEVAAAIEDLGPDLIINAAAYTDVTSAEINPADAFRVNCMGALNLAEAASRRGVGLIHISTDFVFSGPGPHPETAVPNPVNRYGASKLAGELAVIALCPAAVVVRTAWVFDEEGPNFVTRILAQSAAAALNVVCDEVGSPTSARDLAEGLIVLADHLVAGRPVPHRIFHLVNEGQASRLDMAQAILDHRAGRGRSVPSLVPVSSGDLNLAVRRPDDSRLASERLQALTGWHPRPWREALDEVLDALADREDT